MSKFQKQYFYLLGLLLIIFISVGCSGGGGTGEAPSTETSPPTATTPSDLATSTPTPVPAEKTDPIDLSVKSTFSFIPQKEFVLPKEEDFAFNPGIGIETSKRFLLVALKDGATEEQFKEVIKKSNCQLEGTIPGAGIFQIDCGSIITFEAFNNLTGMLRGLPSVLAVSQDKKLSPQIVPKPTPTDAATIGYVPNYTWELPSHGTNWGLEMIGAPIAWNLKRYIEKREGDPQTATGQLPIYAAVIDTGFYEQPDLDGILTLLPGTGYTPTSTQVDDDANHGTKVSFIIGAKWGNGEFTDGISPFVHIYGAETRFRSTTTNHNQWTKTSLTHLFAQISRLIGLNPRPRIVNISLGRNWHVSCYVMSAPQAPQRCDPRVTGRIPDGNACPDPRPVRNELRDDGLIAGQLAEFANVGGDMVFVHAAGNDAGPMLSQGQNLCRDCPDPWNPEPSCPPDGMEDFPAEFSSPFTWAAVHDPTGAGRYIIVAEAGALDAATLDMVRAPYSNVNGAGGFAPADGNHVAGWDGVEWATWSFSGTSAAAPFFSGAAAYLWAVEPRLSAEEVKILLTQKPFAQDMNGGRSATNTRLNLFFATAGICSLPRFQNDCKVIKALVDTDDGSLHGFLRITKDDNDHLDGVYPTDVGGDGKVDIKDFRRLRDNYLLFTNALKASSNDPLLDVRPGKPANEKFDLNKDTDSPYELNNMILEVFPRVLFTYQNYPVMNVFTHLPIKSPFLDRDRTDLDVLSDYYKVDPIQPWPKEALPLMLMSADIDVRLRSHDPNLRSQDAVTVLGATGIEIIEIQGEAVPEDKDIPKDLKPLQNILLDAAKTSEVFLTTPKRKKVEIMWKPICGASKAPVATYSVSVNDGQILESGNYYVATFRVPECSRDCNNNLVNPDVRNCQQTPPPVQPKCGDGKVNGYEACDTSDVGRPNGGCKVGDTCEKCQCVPLPPPPFSVSWTLKTTEQQTTQTANNVTITTNESHTAIRNLTLNSNKKGTWSVRNESCSQGCDEAIMTPCYEGCRTVLTETDCDAGRTKVTTSSRSNLTNNKVAIEGITESSSVTECPVRRFQDYNSTAPSCTRSGAVIQNDGDTYVWSLGTQSGSYRCSGCGGTKISNCRCKKISDSNYVIDCGAPPPPP